MHTRLAELQDIPQIEELIPVSVRSLQAAYYSAEQMEGALGTVFAVDTQLIRDGTYFVVEEDSRIIGCGGWSRRTILSGGDRAKTMEDALLDPTKDAARIRAFFVHPDFARRGIGRHLIGLCERAIAEAGFTTVRMVATLAGEPLYAQFGYQVHRRYDLTLTNGLLLPAVDMRKTLTPGNGLANSAPTC